MAIHPLHPGLEVSIETQGKPLPEYTGDDEHVDPTLVTKYAEALPGADFAIAFKFAAPFPTQEDVAVRCFIDGILVRHSVWRRWNRRVMRRRIAGTQEKERSGWVEKSFRFSSLSILEDAQHETRTVDQVADIGTIKILLVFGQVTKIPHGSEARSYQLTEQTSISEKAVKGNAKSMSTISGSTKAIKPVHTCNFKSSRDGPFATFLFKYRSRADLEALHVVPRTTPEAPRQEARSSTPADQLNIAATASVLTKDTILSLIEEYGGNKDELSGLSREVLLTLLEGYRAKTQFEVKCEPSDYENDAPRVKRERQDDDALTRRAKNVRYEDAILLE